MAQIESKIIFLTVTCRICNSRVPPGTAVVVLKDLQFKGYDTNLYFHKSCWQKQLQIKGEWKSNVNV
jgi:hypothetical protein